jgi:hypothetical protein
MILTLKKREDMTPGDKTAIRGQLRTSGGNIVFNREELEEFSESDEICGESWVPKFKKWILPSLLQGDFTNCCITEDTIRNFPKGNFSSQELTKIAFVSIAEGEIKSAEMKVEARAQNGNLLLVYKIANIRAITLTATKDSYTYDEIRRTLLTEVLSYGAPVADALPEREDGTAIPEDASLGKGTYRLLCYLPTSEGVMVQSYVYLTLQ